MLEVAINRWVRNFNFTNFSNANTRARAITVEEADSTEKQSVTWEYEALATLPLMGRGEDFITSASLLGGDQIDDDTMFSLCSNVCAAGLLSTLKGRPARLCFALLLL